MSFMPSPVLLEDHRDAYFHWKELGLRDKLCLHIDAHLDVSNLKAPGSEVAKSPKINCGNFLLPALQENVLSSLIWVIPKHLPGEENLLEWTRLELQNWLRIDLSDYMSLEKVGARVEGQLLGKPFTVCFSNDVPRIEAPHVLDIDIDYYLDPHDNLWQSPLELAADLQGIQPDAVTIAYSLQGGYTPVQHRFLGPLTELALEDPESAADIWSALQTQPSTAVESWPEWSKAAYYALKGQLKEAAEIDPGYRIQHIDRVSAALMREQFEQAWLHLQKVQVPAEATFMKGMISLREGCPDVTVESWAELLEQPSLGADTRVYLLTTCGRVLLQMGRHAEAYRMLNQAHELTRKDSEILSLMARACIGLKKNDEGARLFRRAIKLDPELLETYQFRLELAEIYLGQGQRGLAESLIRRTLNGNTPGFMKLRAEALQLKLALRQT
jgi:tetratricopeptide (TPR) repeat protein